MEKPKTVRVYLELPADIIVEQISDWTGRVLSTVIEADLCVDEIHRGLAEYEAALREFVWSDE